MPSEQQFYEALHAFLPKGQIWPSPEASSNVNTLIENVAFSMKEIDDDASAEFDDIFPDTSNSYLADWERVLKLPKSFYALTPFIAGTNTAGDPLGTTAVTTPTPTTDDERRNIILAMLDNNPLNNAAFYEDLAALFGMSVTISTGVSALQWQIIVTADPGGKVDLFTAYTNFFKPAHTEVTIS